MPVVYDSFKDTAVTSLEVTPAYTYLFYVYGAGGGGGGTGGGKGSAGTFVSGKFTPTAKFTIHFTKGTGGTAGDGSSTGGSAGGASTVITADSGATLSIIAGSGAGGNTSASSVIDAVAGSLTGNKKNLYGAETITASSGFGQGGAGSVKGTNGTSSAAAVGGYSFAGGTAITGSVSYETIPTSLNVGLGGNATSAGQNGYIYITTEDKENAQGIPLTAGGVVAIVSSQVTNQAKIAAIAAGVAANAIQDAILKADAISNTANVGTQTVDADGNPVFIIASTARDVVYTLTYIYPGFKVTKTAADGTQTTTFKSFDIASSIVNVPFIDTITLEDVGVLQLEFQKRTSNNAFIISLNGTQINSSYNSLQKNVKLKAIEDTVASTQANVDSIRTLNSSTAAKVKQVNATFKTQAETAAANIATSLTNADATVEFDLVKKEFELLKNTQTAAIAAAATAEALVLETSYPGDNLAWRMAKTAAGAKAAEPFVDTLTAAAKSVAASLESAKTNSAELQRYVDMSKPPPTDSNADVLKAIVSLIVSINKQIAALQKLILKR